MGCGIQLSRAVYSSCVLELLNLHLKKKKKKRPLLFFCAKEMVRERFSLQHSSHSVIACGAEMGLSGGSVFRDLGNSMD